MQFSTRIFLYSVADKISSNNPLGQFTGVAPYELDLATVAVFGKRVGRALVAEGLVSFGGIGVSTDIGLREVGEKKGADGITVYVTAREAAGPTAR